MLVEDCQDYKKLKVALLTAYAIVPEVYRKHFRNLTKQLSEMSLSMPSPSQSSEDAVWRVRTPVTT